MSDKNTINWSKIGRVLSSGLVPGAAIGGICLIWMYWWAALLIAIPSTFFLGLCLPDQAAIKAAKEQKRLMAAHEEKLYDIKEDMPKEFY